MTLHRRIIFTLAFVLLFGLASFTPQAHRIARADDSIGGVWNTGLTTVNSTFGFFPMMARAYPVGQGAAPVDHVNFTALINGNWTVVCQAFKPDHADSYGCTWWPGTGSWNTRDIRVSFDVYNTVGGVHLAPNGEHTAHFTTGKFLQLPFTPGQTWYVCQGYNGPIDHTSAYYAETALDLSISPQAASSGGCDPNTADASTGQPVLSPADGTVANYFAEPDFVCITFDAGGSTAIGHINSQPTLNTRVHKGGLIGYVNPPQSGTNQGGYAHIHIQVFTQPDCPYQTYPVPFDEAHNAAFAALRFDMPYDPAGSNQYSGVALTLP